MFVYFLFILSYDVDFLFLFDNSIVSYLFFLWDFRVIFIIMVNGIDSNILMVFSSYF